MSLAQISASNEEMTKAAVDWQVINYGDTISGLTNPDAASIGAPETAYNKSADERSWQAMKSFFAEIIAT